MTTRSLRILWISCPPAVGKSTVAWSLYQRLVESGAATALTWSDLSARKLLQYQQEEFGGRAVPATIRTGLVLVAPAADLVRDAGRKQPILLHHPRIRLRVAEIDYDFARTFLKQMPDDLQGFRRLGEAKAEHRIEIIPPFVYEAGEPVARRRTVEMRLVPALAVALSLRFGHGIVSDDDSFAGLGVPTWSLETVIAELSTPDDEPSWWFPTRDTVFPPVWPLRLRLVPRH